MSETTASETTASEAMLLPASAEGTREPAILGAPSEEDSGLRSEGSDFEAALEVEVEEILPPPGAVAARAGFGGSIRGASEEDKPTEPHLPGPLVKGRRNAAPSSASGRLPPPLPPRIEREPPPVTEVVISPSGEVVHGLGSAPDEFAARVAYAARLAELIGRAIRSGTPRAVELQGKGTQTHVRWQPDGSLTASFGLLQSPKLR